jgi:hypothetical protein
VMRFDWHCRAGIVMNWMRMSMGSAGRLVMSRLTGILMVVIIHSVSPVTEYVISLGGC